LASANEMDYEEVYFNLENMTLNIIFDHENYKAIGVILK